MMTSKRSNLNFALALIPLLLNVSMAQNGCSTLTCLNGGTCYAQIRGDVINEYCICPPDKQGETCAEHKECDLNCIHGQCLYPFNPAGSGVASDVEREPFCQCDEGYTGILCESEVVECPDGHTCYNGGVCQELFHTGPKMLGQSFKEPKYTCDCSVIDSSSPFAGLSCQHPAEKICSLMTVAKSSFCVNGGTCKDMVMTEDLHRGCDCPRGFEGPHCEFAEGTDPNNNMINAADTTDTTNTNVASTPARTQSSAGGGLSGIGFFAIVLTLTASFSAGIVTAYRMKQKRLAIQEAQMAYDDNDLAFDADGNRMTNISINGDPAEREGEII